MNNICIELFVIATIISDNLINANKSSSGHISPDEPNLIPIKEWFQKVSDPKFNCNQLAENEKLGT